MSDHLSHLSHLWERVILGGAMALGTVLGLVQIEYVALLIGTAALVMAIVALLGQRAIWEHIAAEQEDADQRVEDFRSSNQPDCEDKDPCPDDDDKV